MIVHLERKIQSKHINYAKQSQFPKKSNVYNISINNKLQRKIENGHLVKTNPNKANFKWWAIRREPVGQRAGAGGPARQRPPIG
jgi:hypothetical protein